LTPDHATKAFSRLRDRVGLPDVRLHDLRHFAATRLLAAGVPVRTVSGRLGHANAATTLGVYAHFVQESDREAAAMLGPWSPRRAAQRIDARSRHEFRNEWDNRRFMCVRVARVQVTIPRRKQKGSRRSPNMTDYWAE
jgi:hypothetical protein